MRELLRRPARAVLPYSPREDASTDPSTERALRPARRRPPFRAPILAGIALLILTLVVVVLPADAQTPSELTTAVPDEITVYEGEDATTIPLHWSGEVPDDCKFSVYSSTQFLNKDTTAIAADIAKPRVGGISGNCKEMFPGGKFALKIAAVDDDIPEEDEYFWVGMITSQGNGQTSFSLTRVNIKDDDATLKLSPQPPFWSEASTVKIDATVEGGFGRRSSVDVKAFTGYGGDATVVKDYTPYGKTLTFSPTQRSGTFSFQVKDDQEYEGGNLGKREQVYVWFLPEKEMRLDPDGMKVSHGSRKGLAAIVNILDIQHAPEVSISNPAAVAEDKTGGLSRMVFDVTLSGKSQDKTIVYYDVMDVAGVANATPDTMSNYGYPTDPNSDYALPALPDGETQRTLTFAPGETGKQITVFINRDKLDEEDETIGIELGVIKGATILPGQGTGKGVITDNDDTPFIRGLQGYAIEHDSQSVYIDFYFSLTEPSGKTITATYVTQDGTAEGAWNTPQEGTPTIAQKNDADFVHQSGMLTFKPGERSKVVNVRIRPDTTDKVTENLYLKLSNLNNVRIWTGPRNALSPQGLVEGIIIDDDQTKKIEYSVGTTNVREGATGDYAAFTPEVNLPGDDAVAPSGGLTLDVNWAPSDSENSAEAADIVVTCKDPNGPKNSTNCAVPPVKITGGANWGYSEVRVIDDNIDEPAEVFFLRPGPPPAGYGYNKTTFDTNSTLVTITDNDPTTVTVRRLRDGSILENGGIAFIIVELGRELVAGETLTLPLTFTGATHKTHFRRNISSGAENVSLITTAPYSKQNPALVFSPGSQTATIGLQSLPNDDVNENRTITVTPGAPALSYLLRIGGGAAVSGNAVIPVDDDDVPIIEPTAVTVTEAGGTSSSATYTISLAAAPLSNRVISGAIKDGTAADIGVIRGDPTKDFLAKSFAVRFTPEDWGPKTIRVVARDDNKDNPNDKRTTEIEHAVTFGLRGSVDVAEVAVTVTDDDGPPTFAIEGDVRGTESTGIRFTILRGGATDQLARVKYRLKPDTRAGAKSADIPDDISYPKPPDEKFPNDIVGVIEFVETIEDMSLAFGIHDFFDEDDEETFILELYDATHGAVIDSSRSTAVATIVDDDKRGVVVTPTEVTMLESGPTTGSGEDKHRTGQAKYKIDITSAPIGTITVKATVDDPDVAQVHYQHAIAPPQDSVSHTGIGFPSTANHYFYVSGVDDDVENTGGRRETTITHTVSGGDYDGMVISKVKVIVLDDEVPAFSIADGAAEEGKPVEFVITRTLAIDEVATVQYVTEEYVRKAAGDPNAAGAADYTPQTTPKTVTFVAGDTTKTISVATAEDKIDEDAGEIFLVKISSDDGIISDDVATGTITDNDTRGITVSTSSISLTEPVSSDTYTVVLDTQPTVATDVALSPIPGLWASLDKLNLTFTPSNWDKPQTVRVKVIDNDIDNAAGRKVLIGHFGTAGDYDDLTGQVVTVTIADDDTRGYIVRPTTPIRMMENDGEGVYSIRLKSQPTSPFTVNITPHEILGSATPVTDKVVLDRTSITFNEDNWNKAQLVTVYAVDDFVDAGGGSEEVRKISIAHTLPVNTGGDYYRAGNPDSVRVDITDDDGTGIIISKSELNLNEGASTTYTVRLASQPMGMNSVEIALGTGAAPVTLDKSSLTFTTTNWRTPQTVTVTATDDKIDKEHPTATDSLFDAHTITHKDLSGYSTGKTPYMAPGAAVLTVRNYLKSEDAPPAHYARWQGLLEGLCVEDFAGVGPMTEAEAQANVDQGWMRWDPYPAMLKMAKAAGCEWSLLRVNVTDDDARGVKLSVPDLKLLERDDPNTAGVEEHKGSYTIVLTSQPTMNVEIRARLNTSSKPYIDYTPDLAPGENFSLFTFTPSTWNIPQTAQVAAKPDNDSSFSAYEVVHKVVSKGDYNGMPDSSLQLRVSDVSRRFSITPGAVVEGGTIPFTITRDADDVRGIEWRTSDEDLKHLNQTKGMAYAGVDYIANNGWVRFPTGVSFVTIHVRTINDAIDEEDEVFAVAVRELRFKNPNDINDITLEPVGDWKQPLVSEASILDNDTRGVTISKSALSVDEGDTATYTIVLDTKPTGNVPIDFGVQSNPAGSFTRTGTVKFTPDNWNVPQTVTVAGVNDDKQNAKGVRGTGTIAHSVPADPPPPQTPENCTIPDGVGFKCHPHPDASDYAEFKASSVRVIVNDDDGPPTFSISDASANEGDEVEFTVTRTGAPGHRVRLSWWAIEGSGIMAADAPGDFEERAHASRKNLLFGVNDTTTTFKVKTEQDDIAEGDETFMAWIELADTPITDTAVISDDSATATIVDDDTRGVTISTSSMSLSENGGKRRLRRVHRQPARWRRCRHPSRPVRPHHGRQRHADVYDDELEDGADGDRHGR